MKRLINKLFGIDKILLAKAEASQQCAEAEERAAASLAREEVALESERVSALSPKTLATENKEPWIAVLDTHVNKDNLRNGFFELDWNEYFVLQLRTAGYGGTTDEETVDEWFTSLCQELGKNSGVSDMARRGSGYINTHSLKNGKAEVS